MIAKAEVVPLLLSACPTAHEKWAAHIAWWKGESAGSFNDVAVLADHIVESYSAGRTDELSAFFAVVERVFEEGDSSARELTSTGLIEDIQNIASHREVGLAPFVQWLGPKSRNAWDRVSASWGPVPGRLA